MAQDKELNVLMVINATLLRMERQLSDVCNDVEDLEKSRQEVVQLHVFVNSGMVQSTPAESAVIMHLNSGGIVDDEVITGAHVQKGWIWRISSARNQTTPRKSDLGVTKPT